MHLPTAPALPFAGSRGRLFAAIIGLAVLAGTAAVRPPAALAFGGDGLRAAANEYRTDAGLEPVVGTALLDDIASHRASQMVASNLLEHDIDYVTSRLNNAGVCWQGVGEIIAWEAGWPSYDYDRTVLAWWNSPTHRDIMMGSAYNAAGGAWRTASDGAHYSVMVFVTLCSATATEVRVSLLKPQQVYSPTRGMVLARGWHTAFRFSASGDVIGRKTITYRRAVGSSSYGRAYVGKTAFLKVASGALKGYWVREGPSSYVRGMTSYRVYDPTRLISIDAGRYWGYRFTWYGKVTDSIHRRYNHGTHAMVTARAVINGRVFLRLKSGWLSGYWVRDTSGISFR